MRLPDHKCILAKGEDFAPCRQFWLAYRSLCPSGWYQRWDDQRGSSTVLRKTALRMSTDPRAEAGNFPVRLE
jgi:cytochrome c oxidase subunit 6b